MLIAIIYADSSDYRHLCPMNVTFPLATSTQAANMLDQVWSFLIATRAELFLFSAAVAAYMLLFGNASPKSTHRSKAKRIKVVDNDERVRDTPTCNKVPGTEDPKQTARNFAAAFEAGDHRQVLRCWNVLKRLDQVPPVPLLQAVESMQRFKKDPQFVLRELKAFFVKFPSAAEIRTMNDLVESLAKRLDSDLAEEIVSLMRTTGVDLDQRTHEILLSMYFTMRNFTEVRKIIQTMKSKQIPRSNRCNIIAVKTALKMGDFQQATEHFVDLKQLWTSIGGESGTPSNAPRHIVSQLVELACRDHRLAEVLPRLEGVPVTEDAVSFMLSECIKRKDPTLTGKVEKLVRDQGYQLSDATYTLLIKSATNDPSRVQALLDEVVSKESVLSSDFAMALLTFCSQTRSLDLADQLFNYMKPKYVPVLSSFIKFYAESEQPDKACDVYEKYLQNSGNEKSQLVLDTRIERCLMAAALKCGRHDLAKTFLDAAPSDVAKHITMIRNCAASGNLIGAMKVFETLKNSGTEINSVAYNTVLDACVECRDLKAAEEWMASMKKAGLTDVVSYNTLIKAHLQRENFSKSRTLMEEMRSEGLSPNRVTYNELVNALVTRGSHAQRREVWSVVREMKAIGVKPNQVTCSILLKSLNKNSSEADIMETMDLIGSMDEAMDEVLLSSVVEACVRIGKPDLLAEKLKQLHCQDTLSVNGSHTFGSLIKAYGHARDIDGVWRCWREMRSRHIRPTSITLGCMVEAVVSNGDTEGAYDLVHQMQDDERCRDAINAVIYCSVLKGFTREKRLQRVVTVYEEMLERKVELSIVTYNTLLDACARCSRMDKIPVIIADMKESGIKPNLITYSTMVKGHCQAGDIELGFDILEQMRKDTDLKPDEIMYNSLLDGCAQNNLADQGLALLERMQDEGVTPSNFTLSLLVKLMNRCRRLDDAFRVVEEISTKHRFRPNVHVYTNLMQACVASRQIGRAMSTFQKMLSERIRPEMRTYSILVRSSLAQNQCEQAAGLLRAAIGLSGAEPYVAERQAKGASVNNLDSSFISEVLGQLADKGRAKDLGLPLVADLKRHTSSIRIDGAVQRRLMGVSCEEHKPNSPNGNGERRRGYRGGRGDRNDNSNWRA